MGIQGLTSFIEDNGILQDYRLSNCRVVVDGNSFFHFVYFDRKVSCQFGGDYDVYQREICRIFSIFKECKIEAYVVFDGAYTVDGKKLKTTIKRAKERISDAKSMIGGDKKDLIPCLAQQTFRQTLDTLGIKHVTCDFEADNQLVTLANLWKCPVISDDSDFYIFELSGGFIPLRYIDFPRCDGSITFLRSKHYDVNDLLELFPGLSRSVLPVLATVQGNDYVDAELIKPFYTRVIRYGGVREEHQKIKAILDWLDGRDDADDLVSEILSFISPRQQQMVGALLAESIRGYRDIQTFESFNLEMFFEKDESTEAKKTDFVKNSRREPLPAWFIEACRIGEIQVSLLNVALSQCVILPTQVEGNSMRAASKTSLPIRQVAYGLLLGKEDKSTTEVVEYTKQGVVLQPFTVQIQTVLTTCGRIPELGKIDTMTKKEGRAILLETLGVSEELVSTFDPELQLYMACLVFWAKRAKRRNILNHMKAIVLCAVLLHVHKELAERKNGKQGSMDAAQSAGEESSEISIRSVCRSAEDELLEMVSGKLKKYYETPKKISSHDEADEETFHRTAEFQACVLDALQFNCLLQCPLLSPQPADLFNGSLIYTVVQKLEIRNNPESFFPRKLGESSPLATLFDSICSAVVAAAWECIFTKSSEKKKKKKKKETTSHWRSDGVVLEGREDGPIEVRNFYWPLLDEEDS